MLNIRKIRREKNLTQDDVVELSGIKKRTYVNYENGISDIPFSKLQNIASALGVDIIDLIISVEQKNNLNKPSLKCINSKIKELDEKIKLLKGTIKLKDRLLEIQGKYISKLEEDVERLSVSKKKRTS